MPTARRTAPPPPPGQFATMSVPDAISEGGLLAHDFRQPSWRRWKAIMKAAAGQPLSPEEDELFRAVAQRDPPTRQVKELWVVAGRRAGKDSIASAIATCAALNDYSAYLRTGEVATIACLASTREQSAIVFKYIRGYFAKPPLNALVVKMTDSTIELSNSCEIVVQTNDFRVVRGKSIVVAILDEVAYYKGDDSANSDKELYNAILPAMATFPNPMLIGISSPYIKQGLLYDKWAEYFGKNDPNTLVLHGGSRDFSFDLVPQAMIDQRLAEDPEGAGAEYLGRWRSDGGTFLDRETVLGAVDRGVTGRPPMAGVEYVLFIDPSGGRADAFAAAIAHDEDGVAVVDVATEWMPPFDPGPVVADIANLAEQYGVSRVSGDRHAEGWVTEAFARVGLAFDVSDRTRSDIYTGVLPLFASGRIKIPDNARLVHELVTLERHPGRTGKDAITHPKGGADDLANAVSGAAVKVISDAKPVMIKRQYLLAEDGSPWPVREVWHVTTVVAMSKATSLAGVLYVGLDRQQILLPGEQLANPVVVLDFDLSLPGPNLFQGIAAKAMELGEFYNAARNGSDRAVFMWTDPRIAERARFSGLNVDEIPATLLRDDETSILALGQYAEGGLLKLSAPAVEKAATHPLGGAIDFRAGDRSKDNPLRQALLWALALMLAPMP
jgi:hypothetical protein